MSYHYLINFLNLKVKTNSFYVCIFTKITESDKNGISHYTKIYFNFMDR